MTQLELTSFLERFGWHKGMIMGEELDDEWFKDRAEIRMYDDHLVYYAHPEWVYGESFRYEGLTLDGDRLVHEDGSAIML